MKKLIFFFVFIVCFVALHAQKNYAVKVSDSKTGEAIAGATIKIKSNNQTVITSTGGTAVLQTSSDDSLVVTAKDYISQEVIMLGQGTAVSVVLAPKPKEKEKEKEKVKAVTRSKNKN